jgi:hypothetical protein
LSRLLNEFTPIYVLHSTPPPSIEENASNVNLIEENATNVNLIEENATNVNLTHSEDEEEATKIKDFKCGSYSPG